MNVLEAHCFEKKWNYFRLSRMYYLRNGEESASKSKRRLFTKREIKTKGSGWGSWRLYLERVFIPKREYEQTFKFWNPYMVTITIFCSWCVVHWIVSNFSKETRQRTLERVEMSQRENSVGADRKHCSSCRLKIFLFYLLFYAYHSQIFTSIDQNQSVSFILCDDAAIEFDLLKL